jgi:hypothetical protein
MRLQLLLILAAALSLPAAAQTGAVPVTISGAPGSWTLLRGGSPYFIRGAAGSASPDLLAARGADSVRTWGADQLDATLAAAQGHGLTVLAGIWLGHKEDVDYSDPAKVAAQQEAALAVVRQYKDEPGILAWGLGNEMETDNDTPELWKAVGALAARVKALDPDHPTVTVVAEISAAKLAHIREYAPDIDILGVNSYGGALTVSDRLEAGGWTKPYIITEFGPSGPWESAKTSWGAGVEPTSTQKAVQYRRAYTNAVLQAPGRCLGSYAFLWGYKYEGSATWFGMLMPRTQETLGAVDVMTELWSGSRPNNSAPVIESFDFYSSQRSVAAGAGLQACVKASDPDGDALETTWRLTADKQDAPDLLAASTPERSGPCVSFPAPSEPGAYRLYVELRDGRGHGATANGPFLVGK